MKIQATISDLAQGCNNTTFKVTTDANPEDIESLIDKDLDIELNPHREHRSLRANAKLWASLSELASKLHTTTWEMYLMELKNYGSKFVQIKIEEEAFESFKKEWRTVDVVGEEEETRTFINADTGYPEEVTVKVYICNCYFGSHTYDTKEFSDLLTGVIQDMDALGIPSYEMRRLLKDVNNADKVL